jgi:hypothetical protein
VVLASTNGRLYLADAGISYDGSNPAMNVERTGLALGASSRIKLVKSVSPRIDATAGTVVNIRVGAATTADGTVTWSSQIPYTVGTSRAAHGLVSGAYVAVKLESTAGATWRCRSMDIEYELTGRQ